MGARNVSAAQFLRELRAHHGKAPKTAAPGDATDMPAPVPAPEIENIAHWLSAETCAFLQYGEHGADRSEALRFAARDLKWAGLSGAEILAVLSENTHAFGVALDHRAQDEDRASAYLWQHHAGPAAVDDPSRHDIAGDFGIVQESDAPGGGEGQKAPRAGGLSWCSAEDFCAEESRLEWFVNGVLPEAELCAIFGASGAGKTFFALHLLATIAQGGTFFGIGAEQAPVAVIALEGVHGFRDRLRAYSGRYGAVPGLHVAHGSLNLREPGSESAIVLHLRAIGPRGVLAVDTLAQASAGADENSGKDMGAIVARLKTIHARTGWTILLIAHSGKNEKSGLRGWSGIKAALDCEIEVVKTANYRAATVTKLKDGAGEGAEFRFALDSLPLADRTAGVLRELGTAGVSFEGFDAPTVRPPRGSNQRAALAAFDVHAQDGEIKADDLIGLVAANLTGAGKPRERAREAITALCRPGGPIVLSGDVLRRAPDVKGGATDGA